MVSIRSFIKKNKIYYCGISIILVITAAIGMLFLELNKQTDSCVRDVIEQTNLEEFSFYPNLNIEEMVALSESDYSKYMRKLARGLSKEYHFLFDMHPYKVVKDNGLVLRVYQGEREIDTVYVIEGSNQTSEGSVLIDFGYAKCHKLHVGDSIVVNDKKYEISGIVLYPDKLSPVVDNTGLPYSRENQAILTFSELDYKDIESKESYEFVGKGKKNFDIQAFQEDSSVYTVTPAKENPQVLRSIESKYNMNLTILCFSMTLLFSIAMLLLIMTILNTVNTEAPRIGVMKALGYNNHEISCKYFMLFPLILIPCMIGYGIGYYLLDFFGSMMLSDMPLPISRTNISYIIAIILVLVPAVFFSIMAYIVSFFKVRKPALELIRSGGKRRENIVVRRINNTIKEKNFLKGVKKTVLYARFLVLFFVIFGGFALGVQIQFAFMMYNMTSNLTRKIMDGVNYEYSVRSIRTLDDEEITDDVMPYYQESARLDTMDSDRYSIECCVLSNKGSDLLTLTDKSGEVISKQDVDGIIINDWMQLHYGLSEGDTVRIRIGANEYEVKVAAVCRNIYGSTVYTNMDYALKSKLIGKELYNGYYSNKKVEFDAEKHLSITSTSEVIENVENNSSIYMFLSLFFLITGIVIGLSVLVLSMHTVVTNYQKYISLMKILGYSERECGKIIMGFRTAALIGFIVSIPYTVMLCYIMFGIISANSDIIYTVQFDPFSTAICFVVAAIMIHLVLYISLLRIRKISYRIVLES